METVKSVETVFEKLHYVWRCDEVKRRLNVLHSMPNLQDDTNGLEIAESLCSAKFLLMQQVLHWTIC